MQAVHRRIDAEADVAVVWRVRSHSSASSANLDRLRTSGSVSLCTPRSWLQESGIYR